MADREPKLQVKTQNMSREGAFIIYGKLKIFSWV
jgi:hypothetical protein